MSPAGFQDSFRKFFKFQVLKPLDVKTKFYNAETDEVYLEAQVSRQYCSHRQLYVCGRLTLCFFFFFLRYKILPPAQYA